MREPLELTVDATYDPPPAVAPRPSLVPDLATVEARIPRAHPRILFLPGDFARLRPLLNQPPFEEVFQALVTQAEPHLGRPLPEMVFPPDFCDPDLGPWDRRYSRSTEGIQANMRMT